MLWHASELSWVLLRISHVRSLTQTLALSTLLPLPLARLLHEARVGWVALARELLAGPVTTLPLLASKPRVELLSLEALLRELLAEALLREVSRELSLAGKLPSSRELLRELSWLLWHLAIRILRELPLEL